MPDQKTAEPNLADQLADEAVPPKYPAGAPLLMTIAQIRPRSRRAEFKRKLADFTEKQDAAARMKRSAETAERNGQGGQPKQIRNWAEMDDIYQLMVELMVLAAVNPELCTEWADNADDAELVEVFQVFVKRAQPGEASSSTS